MKNRILYIVAVLGVLFLIPSFGVAKSAPVISIEKTQLNGDYTVQVYSDGKWVDAGKLSFGKHYSDKTVDIGKIISSQQSGKGTVPDLRTQVVESGLSPAQGIRIRLIQKGGGAAHIDSIFLGGSAPIKISQAKDEEFLLKKLSKKDHDVIDAFGKTFELEFPANAGDKTLMLNARVEATVISKTPFQFPLDNLYEKMDVNSKFYSYKLQSLNPNPQPPFLKEYSFTGSGHPSGFTYGWVSNDNENLYVKIDFTPDNTVDGEKDYTKVYVKTDAGLREFKISETETMWGNPDFTYTDKVPYQHKVYEFKIPFNEIGVNSPNKAEDLQLAFAAYGTAGPSVAPASHYFGTIALGMTAVQTITISGTQTLGVLSTGGSIEFVLENNTCNNRDLLNDGSCTVDIRLSPSDIGHRNATLAIPNTDIQANVPLSSDVLQANSKARPSIAFNEKDNNYLAVYQKYGAAGSYIAGRIVDNNGTEAAPEFFIPITSFYGSTPKAVYDTANNRFLVVWHDDGLNIYGQFTDRDGNLVHKDGSAGIEVFNISDIVAGDENSYPAVAYDSSVNRFLVVWQYYDTVNDIYEIHGQLINANGLLQGTNFVISSGVLPRNNPSVAYNSIDHNYLVAWQDGRSEDWNIYGQRIGADGSLIAVNFEISNIAGAGNHQLNPAVAYDSVNNRYLVIWDDTRNASLDIYGQIVNANGSLFDNNGTIADPGVDGIQNDNFVISNSGLNVAAPSVAFDSVNRMFLVTWSGVGIYGQLVKADGSLYKTAAVDNFVISDAANIQTMSSVAFNSNYADFMVAFQDQNANPYTISYSRVGSAVRLPQTGQAICYDAAGKPVSCSTTGQDGAIQAGVAWPEPRFTNPDGSVPVNGNLILDKLTGLMWPKDGSTPTAGACTGGTQTWQGALNYAFCLKTTNYLGYSDWRLPNINELESLVNANEGSSSYWLYLKGFSNVNSNAYWSSTNVAGSPANAWYVDFGSGMLSYIDKNQKTFPNMYVMPVRDSGLSGNVALAKTGQALCYDYANPTPVACGATGQDGETQTGVDWPQRFVAGTGAEAACVMDDLTGLMWVRDANWASGRTWQQALGDIGSLNSGAGLCGYKDWRLPNRKEMRSLVDYSRTVGPLVQGGAESPFINEGGGASYWTATTEAASTSNAWYVSLADGASRDDAKTVTHVVWPVRGGAMYAGEADLQVTVVDNSVGDVWAGDNVIYTVTITNNGPDTARSVFLNDVLNGGAISSAIPSQGTCTIAGLNVTCGIGNISDGAFATVSITAVFDAPENWTNTATVTLTNQQDGTSADNTGVTKNTNIIPSDVTLTITPSANGTVTDAGNIDCGPGHVTCSHNYLHDTTVSFTATPEPGYVFAGFGDDCLGGFPANQITVNAAKVCTALFNIQTFSVEINKNSSTSSTGTGRVKSSEGTPNIDCTTGCSSASYDYNINSSVVLTAQADAGSTFTGWSGACAAFGTGPCTLSIDASKMVTATFISNKTLGGVPGEGNLHVTVLDGGSIGVYRFIDGQWQKQIYGWASKGSRLIVNTTGYSLSKYGGSFDLNGVAPSLVSNTRVSDTHISVSWTADGIGLLQDITYQPGAAYFGLKWTINNGSANSLNDLRFFHGEDTYFFGDDDGAGFWDEPNNTVGVQKHIGAGNELRRMYLQAVTAPHGYQSGYYGKVQDNINAGALSNALNEQDPDPEDFQANLEDIDNGYALEWRKDTLAAGETWTIFAYEKFADVPVGTVSVTAPTLTECNSGSTCNLVFTVTNMTVLEKTVTLITGIDIGWVVNMQLTDPTIAIPANGSQQVTLTVTLPSNASAGTMGLVSLYATVGGGVVASDSAAVKAVQVFYKVVPSAGSGGSISPNTSQSVAHGATASFIVTPDPGYYIASVIGCGGLLSVSDYTTGPVTADCTVSAAFELNTYALTVSKAGTGTGTVTGAGTYGHGSSVNVTASADTGSIFAGWSVDCSGSTNPTAVIMDRAKTCTATFELNSYALTVSKAGAGSGTVTGAGTYGHGSSVNVTATADTGSMFTGWSGDCSGAVSPTAVIMDKAKTCTATFAINAYALTVSKAGTGSGTVTGAGIYSPGSIANVTASADANSAFTGWGGDCSGPDNPAAITMDSAKTCVANFAFSYYSLIINKTGEGTITPNPPGMNCTAAAGGACYKYNKGQNVVLIARAEKDYVFKGWSSCTGTGPCKLELDADKTVTASFEAVFPKLSISIDGTDLVPGADNYLEFDKVRVGRLKTKTLKVTNSGNGNLSISGQIEGADMDMFSRKMGSMVTIRPGKSYNIRVTFKPSSANEKAAELIISSNDPETPSFRIDLGGEGFIKKK